MGANHIGKNITSLYQFLSLVQRATGCFVPAVKVDQTPWLVVSVTEFLEMGQQQLSTIKYDRIVCEESDGCYAQREFISRRVGTALRNKIMSSS